MDRVQIGDLGLWQFSTLKRENGIQHFVTDRNSNADAEPYTLSFSSTPDMDLVIRNRSLLAEVMCIPASRLLFPSQVHKTQIVHVTNTTLIKDMLDTDALITNESELCVAVMAADCVPILLFDKRNNAIGAVHSGWRGTVAKILEKTLLKMKDSFGTQGNNLIVGIGPSVCQESYEVGEEVIREVETAFGSDTQLMIKRGAQKALLNLWEANRIQLLEFGVPSENIEVSNLCTVKNNNHFFSARKGDVGRFCAGIMLR
jgi:YfiH family protein